MTTEGNETQETVTIQVPAAIPEATLQKTESIIVTALTDNDFDKVMERCNWLAESDLVPKNFQGKGANILLAIEAGQAIGLGVMASLTGFAVINGRPSLYGDALLAVIIARGGDVEEEELKDAQGKVTGYRCRAIRPGREDITREFTFADAEFAGLTKKDGPWKNYPRRMLQMRARGFALRDQFPDWLGGLISQDEAGDIIDVDPSTGEIIGRSSGSRKVLPPAPTTTGKSNSLLDQSRGQAEEVAPVLTIGEDATTAAKVGDLYGMAVNLEDVSLIREHIQTLELGDEDLDFLRTRDAETVERIKNIDA